MVPRHSALLSTHFLSLTASRIGRSSTGTSIPKALHDLKLDIFGCIWGHLRRHLRMFLIITRTLETSGAFCISLPHLTSKVWCFSWCPFESALLCLFNFWRVWGPPVQIGQPAEIGVKDSCGRLSRHVPGPRLLGIPPMLQRRCEHIGVITAYYSYFRVLESHSAFCATTWCCVVKCTLPNVSLPPEVGRVFTNINHIFNIYIYYRISLCIFEMFGNESKYSLHPSSCQQSDMRATSYRVASW